MARKRRYGARSVLASVFECGWPSRSLAGDTMRPMSGTGLTLICPVRGRQKAKARSADCLTPTEKKLRVDAIRRLIDVGYPKENIRVEAVIKRFGNASRNSFRAGLAS
jgi:hypothetical protein